MAFDEHYCHPYFFLNHFSAPRVCSITVYSKTVLSCTFYSHLYCPFYCPTVPSTFVQSILLSNCPLCIRTVHFYCPLCRFSILPPPRRGGCPANEDLRDTQRCLTNSCKYRRGSRTQSRNARHETHERQRRTRRERRWNGFPEHDLDGSKIFVTNISESAILELVSYISI